MISKVSFRFLLSTIVVISIFSQSAKAEYKNDEVHQDAIWALKEFDTNFKKFGMAGISTQTIPNCYANAGTNYRKIRSCGMLDIWSYSVDFSYQKMMQEKQNIKVSPTNGLNFEEMAERIATNIRKLPNDELKQKYGDDILNRWMKILNESYAKWRANSNY